MLFNKIDLPISDNRDVALKGAARSAEYIVQKESGDKRIVTVIASDESVDRDGDIIRQSGWEGLKTWGKSGAVLWSHNYFLQAVGVPHKAWVEKGEKRLMAELSFPEEYGRAYPASEAVYQGMKVRAIPAVSVGFLPVETLTPDDDERAKLGLGPRGVVFQKQELFEISPCNVASNRNALVQQVKAAGIDTRSLEEMLQHEDNFVIELSSEEKCDGDTLKESFTNYVNSMTDEEREAMKGIDWTITTNHDGDTDIDWHPFDKDYDPAVAKLNEVDYAITLLEEAGYEVTEKNQDDETLTVVIEEPVTVELDLSPEPAISDAALDAIAQSIHSGIGTAAKEVALKRVQRAVRRELNYQKGKYVEE